MRFIGFFRLPSWGILLFVVIGLSKSCDADAQTLEAPPEQCPAPWSFAIIVQAPEPKDTRSAVQINIDQGYLPKDWLETADQRKAKLQENLRALESMLPPGMAERIKRESGQ